MKMLFTLYSFAISFALFAQLPVQGDEFPKLLGQQKSSSQVQSLEGYVGSDPEAKGIKLHYNADSKLTRIELFNGDNPWGAGIQQFQGQMPKGITFADKIVDAKKKIGEGFELEGEVSGTLFISKQFELNNFDSYKLITEYISGRLTSVSMILVEGGSGNLMEDGTTNKSGFKGESLLSIVKKSRANLELQKLIELFGTYQTYGDKTHTIYAENGLEFVTDYSGIVQELTVYAAGQISSKGQQMSAFVYPLPNGLKFQDNQADVIQKLGPPTGEDSGAIYYNYGATRMRVFFGGGKIAKVVIVINSDYKKPEPPVKKTDKPK